MFYLIPLMVVALGALFSEKSGVVNIALEGKMILGGFTSVLFISKVQEHLAGEPLVLFGINFGIQIILVFALLVAVATGIITSLLHAFAAINLGANQIISGVAINMFAAAFAVYVARIVTGTQNVPFGNNEFRIASIPLLGDIPFIGPLFFQNTFITTFIGFAILIISSFVLFKTRFGLRLRACGEHPQAADTVGVSVPKMRYCGVLISGGLAGIGGLIWALPITNIFSGSVQGYGFLALAVLIFGGWSPKKILFAAFFFGIMQTVSKSYHAMPFLLNLPIPAVVYNVLPYVATLIVLAFTSKNTMAPKAVGQPYDKGGR
jgi:simple sugar transport system permease protein